MKKYVALSVLLSSMTYAGEFDLIERLDRLTFQMYVIAETFGCQPAMTQAEIAKANKEIGSYLKGHEGVDQDTLQKSLWRAAAIGDAETVRIIVHAGAKVDHRDKVGRTPAMKAAGLGNISAFQELLAQGADVNATCNEGKSVEEHALTCLLPDGTIKPFATSSHLSPLARYQEDTQPGGPFQDCVNLIRAKKQQQDNLR